ncbi:hypothetical protein A2U01_0046202, partial [Trifolium medium]|nr:hypothetical protein [Trifolium medium]
NNELHLSGKKVNCAVEEIDSGSPQNSSEQLDQKFPATTTVTTSIKKNHTTVVDVIEENHDESDNNENSMLKVMEVSIDDGEEVHIKKTERESETIMVTLAERLESVHSGASVEMSEVHRGIEQVVALELPPDVLPRQEPPAKPPDLSVFVDGGGYARAATE